MPSLLNAGRVKEERANLSKLSVQLHASLQLTMTHTVRLVVFVGVAKPPELVRIPYQFLVAQFLPRTKSFEDEMNFARHKFPKENVCSLLVPHHPCLHTSEETANTPHSWELSFSFSPAF